MPISDYSRSMRRDVETVRAFSCAIARRFRAVGLSDAGTMRAHDADRVLLAIGRQGLAVHALRERLALESRYLGGLLRSLERRGLVRTTARRAQDSRRRDVHLTRAGAARLRRLDAQEPAQVRSLLSRLSSSETQQLLEAMTRIERLMRRSGVSMRPENPSSAAARWCLARYFDELDARFPEGFDRTADGPPQRKELLPPRGRLLIVRLDGVPVGCGAIRQLAPGILEIKRMWVAASVRGLGIGRDLLEALEGIARRRKAHVIRLDTHATLNEALRLYRKAGYRRIARYNDNPYAQRWFEKRLF